MESLKVKDPMISKKPKNMKNKHPLYKFGLLFVRPRQCIVKRLKKIPARPKKNRIPSFEIQIDPGAINL